ncbi:hypothetical protein WN944_005389 [Citrus x changshan-huyou]|uniref:Uncharacterized protein n=1 Tax=Citrus x changshan-huyou TaxID=2935761 RepID=A0AAP0QH49_9ROSI
MHRHPVASANYVSFQYDPPTSQVCSAPKPIDHKILGGNARQPKLNSGPYYCSPAPQFLAFAHGQASNTSLTPAMFIFGETMINSENNNSIMTIARENYRHPHGIDFGYPTDRFCNGISAADCADHNHVQPIFQKPTDLTQYIAKSLFLISIGSNDYINNYLQPSTYASSQIYSGEGFAVLIINNFSEQLSVCPYHKP